MKGKGIEEALQVKLRVLFSLAEDRLRTGLSSHRHSRRTCCNDAPPTPTTQLPAPYIYHSTPSGLSVHMEKVKDGDAIIESVLAQQRGVSETGPAG